MAYTVELTAEEHWFLYILRSLKYGDLTVSVKAGQIIHVQRAQSLKPFATDDETG